MTKMPRYALPLALLALAAALHFVRPEPRPVPGPPATMPQGPTDARGIPLKGPGDLAPVGVGPAKGAEHKPPTDVVGVPMVLIVAGLPSLDQPSTRLDPAQARRIKKLIEGVRQELVDEVSASDSLIGGLLATLTPAQRRYLEENRATPVWMKPEDAAYEGALNRRCRIVLAERAKGARPHPAAESARRDTAFNPEASIAGILQLENAGGELALTPAQAAAARPRVERYLEVRESLVGQQRKMAEVLNPEQQRVLTRFMDPKVTPPEPVDPAVILEFLEKTARR